MSFSIDDAWDNCGPVARAGNTAFGVYCRCGAWVARNISAGYITEPVVPSEVAVAYGSPELARKLVDVGLWEAVDGGWFMPHYFARNETAAQVAGRRKADAERKARWRERQSMRDGTRDKTRESGKSHGVTPSGVRPSFTPPKGGRARDSDAPKTHTFEDDGSGQSCSRCRMLRINKIHKAA